MKKTFILAGLLLTSSFFVYAQSSDEKDIQKQLDEIEQDAKKGDFEHQSSFYADDMVFICNDGKLYTKADRIAHMKTTPHPEVFAFENRLSLQINRVEVRTAHLVSSSVKNINLWLLSKKISLLMLCITATY